VRDRSLSLRKGSRLWHDGASPAAVDAGHGACMVGSVRAPDKDRPGTSHARRGGATWRQTNSLRTARREVSLGGQR
jgi:hypothetical protein